MTEGHKGQLFYSVDVVHKIHINMPYVVYGGCELVFTVYIVTNCITGYHPQCYRWWPPAKTLQTARIPHAVCAHHVQYVYSRR